MSFFRNNRVASQTVKFKTAYGTKNGIETVADMPKQAHIFDILHGAGGKKRNYRLRRKTRSSRRGGGGLTSSYLYGNDLKDINTQSSQLKPGMLTNMPIWLRKQSGSTYPHFGLSGAKQHASLGAKYRNLKAFKSNPQKLLRLKRKIYYDSGFHLNQNFA